MYLCFIIDVNFFNVQNFRFEIFRGKAPYAYGYGPVEILIIIIIIISLGFRPRAKHKQGSLKN